MNYIVIDLEFNQPFHFKTGFQTTLNPDCPFEIIQIGAVKLDEQFHILDKFNALIKPVIYPRIHPYVEKITNLSYEQLKFGVSFFEAYENFVKFIKKIVLRWLTVGKRYAIILLVVINKYASGENGLFRRNGQPSAGRKKQNKNSGEVSCEARQRVLLYGETGRLYRRILQGSAGKRHCKA